MAAPSFSMHTILVQQTERTIGISSTQIKQLIVESDSRVLSLENEITTLESRLATLVKLRDRESATGAALRSLIAPIRTLPVELLAEIFELTICDSDLSKFPYSSRLPLHVRDAFRVSQVCRHWRQIAIGTPRLWTGPITVDFHPTRRRGFEEEEMYADGVKTWLARSAPLPVQITIMGPINRSWLTKSGSRLTDALLSIASRWRSLWIYPAPGGFVERLASCSLDSLEALTLSSVDHAGSHFGLPTMLSFINAPRLRKVTLDTTCGIPMPWVQLTDINLQNDVPPERLKDIFSQCKSVVRACVRTSGWSAFPPARADALVLHHLQFLSVTWAGEDFNDILFLDCISAPPLDELHLCFDPEGAGVEWEEATFTAFQIRSPNITRLKIEGNGFAVPANALVAALRHTPALTHLTIDDCPGTEALPRALCHTGDVEPLVPRLHNLVFGELLVPIFSEDGLASMISSRWWTDAELESRSKPPGVARWRQIQLCAPRFSQSFRDTIENLRQMGLAVELIEYDSR
ncbi:F-box domain-containing protein [Mycena sanguinolenta]|uniref:F-box domain-containing protein n=1 Tax=Mycena sanguinolenta TaxID=230812 RepID=A0A8H7D727_9AGAR|nr:F-box domain-containing protein [Mycena sanguinolenta]